MRQHTLYYCFSLLLFTTDFYYSTCVYAEAGSELDPRTQARDHPRPPLASHQRHKLLQIYPPVYVGIRQHTTAYAGIRQRHKLLQIYARAGDAAGETRRIAEV